MQGYFLADPRSAQASGCVPVCAARFFLRNRSADSDSPVKPLALVPEHVPPLRKILAERCLIVAVYGDRHGFCVVDFQNLFDVAGLDVDVKRHEGRVFVHQCNLHDNTSFSGA